MYILLSDRSLKYTFPDTLLSPHFPCSLHLSYLLRTFLSFLHLIFLILPHLVFIDYLFSHTSCSHSLFSSTSNFPPLTFLLFPTVCITLALPLQYFTPYLLSPLMFPVPLSLPLHLITHTAPYLVSPRLTSLFLPYCSSSQATLSPFSALSLPSSAIMLTLSTSLHKPNFSSPSSSSCSL